MNDIISPENLVYKKPELLNDTHMHYCAGCSHGVVHKLVAEVIEEIAERLAHGEQGITGVMMESFLVGGHQKPAPLDQLVYGQSVTDSCVPWERTNELLHTLADAVTARRSAK